MSNAFFQKGDKLDIKMFVLLLVEKIVLLFNTILLIKPSSLTVNQKKIIETDRWSLVTHYFPL